MFQITKIHTKDHIDIDISQYRHISIVDIHSESNRSVKDNHILISCEMPCAVFTNRVTVKPFIRKI